MKAADIRDMSNKIAHMLLSHAAHGLATDSLIGMGEITLRDGLIVAAAAVGAKNKRAWILRREVTPKNWTDAPVDLMIYRKSSNSEAAVGGVELKFWRKTDAANAANRRRDLVKDFIRAASLYTTIEDFAFVALLSTNVSWDSTVTTSGTDQEAMSKLGAEGIQKWNLTKLKASSAVKTAVTWLSERVPIPNIIHSELITSVTLTEGDKKVAFSKVWLVKKPQNSKMLSTDDIKRFKRSTVEENLKDNQIQPALPQTLSTIDGITTGQEASEVSPT